VFYASVCCRVSLKSRRQFFGSKRIHLFVGRFTLTAHKFSLSQFKKDDMKLSLSVILCAATTSVSMAGNLRRLEEDKLYERNPGSCLTPDQAQSYLVGLTITGQIDITLEQLTSKCSDGGSCMNGDPGCCRLANGPTIECDTENKFDGGLVSIHYCFLSCFCETCRFYSSLILLCLLFMLVCMQRIHSPID
jgi:hypothetical protein